MMCRHYFCVAGFMLSVAMPGEWDADALLPSFRAFRRSSGEGGTRLMDCTVAPLDAAMITGPLGTVIEETANDAGYIRLYAAPDGYNVTLSMLPDGLRHYMQADRRFATVRIFLCCDDSDAGLVLSSLLRIAYSQAILLHDAIALHASAVHRDGVAYLFMGRSGTGKSTHSSLWIRHLPSTQLLNDDNPTVRIVDGRAYAYGTPWSGKRPCYKDLSFPVGGMVRLSQSQVNRFCRQEGTDAFVAILPGCSVISQDAALRNSLYDTLSSLAELVQVATLDCLPDAEAALLCYRALSETHRP